MASCGISEKNQQLSRKDYRDARSVFEYSCGHGLGNLHTALVTSIFPDKIFATKLVQRVVGIDTRCHFKCVVIAGFGDSGRTQTFSVHATRAMGGDTHICVRHRNQIVRWYRGSWDGAVLDC